jgi:ABC-type nitrate/sulfonate/bicarbonate transport system permease component
MSSAEISSGLAESHGIPRQWIVTGGRLALAVALLAAWEWGARAFGPLFFAPPLATAQRIVEMAGNGKLLTDTIATLRVSVTGFVIGCIAGVGLPFLLRLSPRATSAVEPFILASMGIPKYALTPWLILWFGIGDAPKAIVVTLFVLYITFITVFAGVRGVDQRSSTWRASLARASAPSRGK